MPAPKRVRLHGSLVEADPGWYREFLVEHFIKRRAQLMGEGLETDFNNSVMCRNGLTVCFFF